MKVRVSLSYTRLNDSAFSAFGANVVAKMTDNDAFTTPVVPLPDITAAVTLFNTRIADAQQGGSVAAQLKKQAREALDSVLRQQAAYVQSIAGEDLAVLLSSGYEATSSNRTRVQLDQPVIDRISNPVSTVIALRVQPVPTAKSYEVRVSHGTEAAHSAGIFTKSRPLMVTNLTPGVVYTFQVRAIGGISGYSDWSDPVSHMAM
jgi:hypothetical protein